MRLYFLTSIRKAGRSMKRSRILSVSKRALLVAMACLAGAVAGAGAPPQSAPRTTAPQVSSLSNSLQSLQAQVQELSTTLLAVHTEVTRSRAEAEELRRELEQAREQLASFKRELAESRQAVPPSRASSDSSGAQSAPSARLDQTRPAEIDLGERVTKLGARVAGLEEDQQLLGGKVLDQYQAKVESGSKYRVRLSGVALLNVFGTRGSVDNLDLPTLARPKEPLDSGGSFGATVRQSLLGLEVFGPALSGAKTRGDIQFDFFGVFPETLDGVTAGLVRLRTAAVHFDWARTSIVAGQDTPFFSPLSPTSLASLAYPALSYSGNLWTWTPQFRVDRRLALSDEFRPLLQ